MKAISDNGHGRIRGIKNVEDYLIVLRERYARYSQNTVVYIWDSKNREMSLLEGTMLYSCICSTSTSTIYCYSYNQYIINVYVTNASHLTKSLHTSYTNIWKSLLV